MVTDTLLRRRSHTVHLDTVPIQVRHLKRFLGASELLSAHERLIAELRHHGPLYRYWASEQRPWLFALRNYDAIVQSGITSKWPPDVVLLAGDGFMLHSLRAAMGDAMRHKYAIDLLSPQHLDSAHEIRTAWNYHVLGYDINWYEPKQAVIPEFRARGGGFDFDVECRRFSTDTTEFVKSPDVADTCDMICRVVRKAGLWGSIEVEVARGYKYDASQKKRWKNLILEGIAKQTGEIELSDRVVMRPKLHAMPGPVKGERAYQSLLETEGPPGVLALACGDRNGQPSDPILLRCHGPRRTHRDLRDHIYETLNTKVASQLSTERAGVLVVKFDGVDDPSVFNESDGMRSIVSKIFYKHDHLAAICFRCQDTIGVQSSNTSSSGQVILFRNQNCKFRDAEDAALSAPIA